MFLKSCIQLFMLNTWHITNLKLDFKNDVQEHFEFHLELLLLTSKSCICRSIDHAFTVAYTTDARNQTSFCSFALRQVSVLPELALGRLRCILAGAPPQPNSPPDVVFHVPHPTKGLKTRTRYREISGRDFMK
jgi:hypothetical protein